MFFSEYFSYFNLSTGKPVRLIPCSRFEMFEFWLLSFVVLLVSVETTDVVRVCISVFHVRSRCLRLCRSFQLMKVQIQLQNMLMQTWLAPCHHLLVRRTHLLDFIRYRDRILSPYAFVRMRSLKGMACRLRVTSSSATSHVAVVPSLRLCQSFL